MAQTQSLQPPLSAFETAFNAFFQDLEKNPKQAKKLAFANRIKSGNGTSTPQDVITSVEDMVKRSQVMPERLVYPHFRWAVEALKSYTGVIEVMIQAYPMPTALIWGGLKIVLECAARYDDQFDNVKSAVDDLPYALWQLSNFESLYGSSAYAADVVSRVLGASYQTIFKFWYRCTKILEHPKRSMLKKRDKLAVILAELRSNVDTLNMVRMGVEAQLSKELRDKVADESALDQAARQALAAEHAKAAVERAAADVERQEAQKERGRAEAQRQALELERQKDEEERQRGLEACQRAEAERLLAEQERQAAQVHRDHDAKLKREQRAAQMWRALDKRLEADNQLGWAIYESALADRHEGTCDWLFATDAFTKWTADNSAHPVLWLTGKHGAGKSVLCASTIVKSVLSHCCVFQFLTKDKYVSRNQLLRNMAAQLVRWLEARDPTQFPDALSEFHYLNKDDSLALEKLIRRLIAETPSAYIFLDGLDEVEYADEQSLAPTTPGKEVALVVEFLVQEVSKSRGTARLWLSSQPLQQIQRYMGQSPGKGLIQEFPLETKHTARDILDYLGSAIPDSTEDKNLFARLFAAAAVATEVEGSFLWAKTMLDDLKSRADDSDELIRLAVAGLPNRMSEVYDKVISQIKKQQAGRADGLPLWRIVLSLITFAKRPLKIAEIVEGVAMIRTAEGSNLNNNKRTDAGKILASCMSLVRPITQDRNGCAGPDQVLRLSHSAVRAFLLKNSDVARPAVDEQHQLVSSHIIRDCCLRYLLQPRYSRLLTRPSPTGSLQTRTCGDVTTQRLLTYSAKYWYQHFDAPTVPISGKLVDPDAIPPSDRARVRDFLRSPNFQTCLQAQCLFVVGHFLQQFDPVTDQATTLRRTLPNWTAVLQPEIHRQYANFQIEWCHLLQSGLGAAQAGGEVDRCFWGALGPANFLSRNAGRYRSFEFALNDATAAAGSEGDRDAKALHLEKWTLDGAGPPKLVEQTAVAFSATSINLDRYWLPCSQSFRCIPLVPSIDCLLPLAAVSLCLDAGCSALRIGSQIFRRRQSPDGDDNTAAAFEAVGDGALSGPWEEMVARGPYLVVCRRRIPRRRPSAAAEERERARVRRMEMRISAQWTGGSSESMSLSKLMDRFGAMMDDVGEDGGGSSERMSLSELMDRFGAMMDDVGEDEGEGGEGSTWRDGRDLSDLEEGEESSSVISSGDELEGVLERSLPDLSSAEESWSEGTTDTEDESSSSIASDDSSRWDSPEDGASEAVSASIGSEIDLESSFSIGSDSDEDGDEVESVVSCLSLSQLDDDGSEPEFEGHGSDDDMGETADAAAGLQSSSGPGGEGRKSQYPVEISVRKGNKTCDGCQKPSLRAWFHCIRCQDDDFDLCFRCQQQGLWCLDQGHQLYKMVNRQPVGVVSRPTCRVRQELAVYRRDGERKTAIFHFRKKYGSLLYQSPPVLHPRHPLAVWPLTGKTLVFADFASNTFFEQKIKTAASRKAQPICVSLAFSPCGNYLRAATITAQAEKRAASRKPTTPRQSHGGDRAKPKVCAMLHVLVMQLSSRRPTRSPPKLVSSRSLALGPCARPTVQQFPFTFTWCPGDLYVTMSDTCLRVYRVGLPAPQEPREAAVPSTNANLPTGEPRLVVTVPRETIYLPRSSQNRTVQFFPPRRPGTKSTVIIGPRHSRHPTPPVGVYLTDRDLGGWIPVAEEAVPSAPRPALGGQLEDFVEEQDCDLIPFEC
ncbi:hypothetical protein C8A05DRAFT_37409 [Staphylotrichum tortipilum]|uniref:ZZ-type domain-containing protein n=1 Tax=Staphylotrichum tortipilum TaxID=2831512 RepID=A0AAN6MEF2_9PEZI|nr:hypothetical protein C8A05DRAFT_37409 [Staphylotrichum longicolle]